MKKDTDPRMHSAEHILNRTMITMFGCGRCFTAHIEKKKSKCDYHFHRPLTEEEVKEIEGRVNAVIQSYLPVEEEFISEEQAQSLYDLKRLPEDAGHQIRIVKIGDYDACPCIGPHVSSTKAIGAFRIISSSFEDAVLRIRYKLGGK